MAVLVSTQVILIRTYVSFYENEQRSPCEATRQRLPAVRLPLRRAADGPAMSPPVRDCIERGSLTLAPTRLSRRTFVGNAAVDRAVSLKDLNDHPIVADLAELIDRRPKRGVAAPDRQQPAN